MVATALVGACSQGAHVVTTRADEWDPALYETELTSAGQELIVGIGVAGAAAGVSREYTLDTGAPITRMPSGMSCPGSGTLDLSAFVVSGAQCGTQGDNAVIGSDVLQHFALSFDVDNSAWAVDSTWEAQIAQAQPPVALRCTVPFSGRFDDGGAVVRLNVEGTIGDYVVDTGSTFIAVRSPLFASLVADGRAVSSIDLQTSEGVVVAQQSSSSGITPCGAELPRALTIITGLDSLLDQVQGAVGRPIAGLVGLSYLLLDRTVIDFPRGQIRAYAQP